MFLCFAVFTGGLYGAFSAARLFGEREGTYVENLGGYTPYGDSIIQASNLIGGEEIFSTYASAIEANTGKFQPSGIDYIIHVLGDEEREEYVENFVTGEYKYASTIRGDYTVYEDWVRRTNWFFYRELYKNYQPVLVTDYSLIWERTEDTNKIETPVEAGVGRINGDTSVIRVRLPEYDGKAIVDLKISYETEWDGDWLKELAFKRMATVIDRNAGETVIYNLPAETEETYIPVVVEDGYASITIMSRPDECSRLENLKVEAGWVYDYDTVTVEYTERG